jgi:uncharacterized protein YhaN
MEDSLRDVEQVRVPSVLAEASKALSTISDGQYRQLRPNGHGAGLLVVDREGQSKSLDDCSPETAPALYLSERLGLATDFIRRRARLPLIVDDIMAGVDRDLARGMTVALGQMAQETQVLFFTCDPETCVLLADHARAARVVQI